MLRVADRIKKWGTMATGMLDRSKGGMLSTAGKLAAGGALLTLGIGALHVAQAKAREEFNARAASLMKELREELEKAQELQKTLDSRCEELGAKPCRIEPSATAVDERGESAGFKRALESVQGRMDALDKDVHSLRGDTISTASIVTGLKDDLGKLRREHDSRNAEIREIIQNAHALISRNEQANRGSLQTLELNIQERVKSLNDIITSVSSSTGAANEEAIAKVEGLEERLRSAMAAEVLKIASAHSTGNELESRLKEASATEERLKHLVEASGRWEANLETVHKLLAEYKDQYREINASNQMRIDDLEDTVQDLKAAVGEHRKTGTTRFGSSARLLPTMLSALGAVSSGGREKIAAKIVDVLVAQAALQRSADPRVHALYTE
jgi:DNA repair exonuclease SbcCD ATPase subunit